MLHKVCCVAIGGNRDVDSVILQGANDALLGCVFFYGAPVPAAAPLPQRTPLYWQEAKDALLGRVFFYGALARAGLLRGRAAAAAAAGALVGLARKKAFLSEPATAVLLELLGGLDASQLGHVLGACDALQAWLQARSLAGAPFWL